VEFAGTGLWVGVLSSGEAVFNDQTGRSGDLFLGGAPDLPVLQPQGVCHILAVRLTGQCPQAFLSALGAARFADGAACPGAAELILQLCADTGADPRAAYALLCALAHGDETARALPSLVSEAVEAIQKNYMALYGVEELSDQLGVTKSHLVRVFGAAMGIPPGKYLTRVRIEAAKNLLLSGGYTLEMIAGMCGFSGANYLCRVFKRETGLTPAAWRAAVKPRAVPTLPPRSNEIFV